MPSSFEKRQMNGTVSASASSVARRPGWAVPEALKAVPGPEASAATYIQ